MAAAARCVPPDGTPIDGNIFGLTMRQQTIAQAIVSYRKVGNTELVTSTGPCVDSTKWSSRTREFVGEIYDYMNGVGMEEREGFRKALASGASG